MQNLSTVIEIIFCVKEIEVNLCDNWPNKMLKLKHCYMFNLFLMVQIQSVYEQYVIMSPFICRTE